MLAALLRRGRLFRGRGSPQERSGAGAGSLRDRLHSFVGFHVLANRLIADSTVVRGDSAHQAGTFWQRVQVPAGDTVEVNGRFEADWVRVGAEGWRLRRLATAPPK